MNFNVKDVKSWANIRELKVGDKGYFFNSISSFRGLNIDRVQCGKIKYMDENWGRCFKSDVDDFNSYYFFLPLNAVKVDKQKEKKYRPFKTISELEYELNKGNRSAHQFLSVGNDIFIRNKNKNQLTHLIITKIDRDVETNEILFVNDMSPKTLLDNYEIRVGAEWLPFGVEVEDEY